MTLDAHRVRDTQSSAKPQTLTQRRCPEAQPLATLTP